MRRLSILVDDASQERNQTTYIQNGDELSFEKRVHDDGAISSTL